MRLMRYACHSLDEILIHPSVLTKRLLYPVSVGYLEQINEDSKKKDRENSPLQGPRHLDTESGNRLSWIRRH